MGGAIHEEFAHSWHATVLRSRPLIAPARQLFYPRHAEEVERGALELLVKPAQASAFLATCALGFADPMVPTGVWSCPHPDWLCAAAGGYVYLIHTCEPETFHQVEYRPVMGIHAAPAAGLLLFTSHHAIQAWGRDGLAWESDRLSSEGVTIVSVNGRIEGRAWDLATDRDTTFKLDLATGSRLG